MKRVLAALALALVPVAASAQVSPSPSLEDPRLQTIVYQPNMPVRLVTFPQGSLTLMFHPGEQIKRVVLSDGAAFTAAVMERGDTIAITPARTGATATLKVETDRQNYEFSLETGQGLAAAYLVRFVTGKDAAAASSTSQPAPGATVHSYHLAGSRVLRPDAISDDGLRTFIEWSDGRALPAVFGVGPSGGEELVAGYMRQGRLVIDRVYPELVFRFDKEKATATRKAGQS
ncbi:MAG: TrbG/VirB9 family P-type conjugative transfer protein [Candidatus Andeanibacterium colombiense]|uniref:TrbG/VirB9 family P-type conjugative transfer protein n=1 Tax=Candidatus Andeanibacterium colombiense TaxID=3121345 RepID=A0AAJ5X4N5_9SPHN|nr:MAG: TrbG/VirB9 family P-type conjugative transfer protein [Sphingomonadaceae bacterium]